MSTDWPNRPPPVPRNRARPPLPSLPNLGIGAVGIAIAAAVVALPLFVWFFCRIEPGPDQMAVLIHKTGADLPDGQILAMNDKQKGIQLEVLPEGRYFRNPYSWDWRIVRATDIPAGKLGVLTRLYGEDLPHGRIVAAPGTKGIVPEILGLGKHRINPFAYSVTLFDAISVRPGSVGVVTSLVGDDVLTASLPDNQRNGFLVGAGVKGVVPEVLAPGTYYLNPYLFNVVEVSLQSQRFQTSGDDAISFLTVDGFTVVVEGTIEFGIQQDKAALLTHRVGDMDDIVRKLILPRARGFSRVEGSKHPAINFIVGETRQQFQDDLETHLRTKCEPWGVAIKSVLVRNIIPPDEIASVIRDREVAVQEAIKYDQEISQARSKAELVRQEMLALQNKEKVEADTSRIRAVIQANQLQNVNVITANRELDVAKVEAEAATFQSQSILLGATAERDVVRLKNEAEAAVLKTSVEALGGGLGLARYALYRRLAPRIGGILAGENEGLGELFAPFTEGPTVEKGGRP